MLSNDLIRRVEDKVIETILLAQEKFQRNWELPGISFDLISNTIGGQADLQNWVIKINPKFLAHCSDDSIQTTIPHEIAHLITYKLFPNSKQFHGPDWKSVMTKLGLLPTRCHNMLIPELRPHTYICNCQKWFISNLIHKRMSAGQCRRCPKCRGNLVYLNTK